jgi:glutamine synthetase
LLHEKPFAGVNGSGKHVNWSMSDSTGRNLLDPGKNPKNNPVFLTFLSGVLQGITDHADVLRAAIASSGNDHRLGANEAPPAIISCFLRDTLDRILNEIETGAAEKSSQSDGTLDLGVSHLQSVALDNTDRNRTSPFAFTGNKFEFRAVGSSAPISFPTTILNSAVAAGLLKVNARLEQYAKSGVVSSEAIYQVLKETVKATKAVRFEGNGYSDEWKMEAERRGLSNLRDTPAALTVWNDKSKTAFLIESGVFTPTDIESRSTIQWERYIKQRLIEANVAVDMAQTGILPGALKYLGEVVAVAEASARTHISSPAQKVAGELGQQLVKFETALSGLKLSLGKVSTESALDHSNLSKTGAQIAEQLLPKLEELRASVDELEACLPSVAWPYPTYQTMLFPIE